MTSPGNEKRIYVTLGGLPLSFELTWPFHKSTSGADFWVLHADVRLEGSDDLHAPVAVNLSVTLREVLPTLEAKDVEGPVINSLRKEVDKRQLEFLKSGKLVPVQFSSRHYSHKRQAWVFGKASDEEMALLVARKVFWQKKLAGTAAWIGDPTEALYVETTPSVLMDVARKLEGQGLLKLDGEWASATDSLMAKAESFEADKATALADLEKKHAFERGVPAKPQGSSTSSA